MKKYILILGLLASVAAQAQWTRYTTATPYYVYTTTATDKVRIGGSGQPSEMLHVFGNTQTSGNLIFGTTAGTGMLHLNSASNNFALRLNATDRITVLNSNGNVGIGSTATNPLGKLQVDIASTNTSFPAVSGSDVGLFLKNTSATANNLNVIGFGDSGGWGVAHIGAVFKDHTSHTGSLFFSTRQNGGALTQRMVISETGIVGIGTTTPGASYKLDVNGIINATGLYLNNAPFVGSQWTTAGSNIYYNTAGGNVGIGTSTPTSKLQVDISSANTNYASLTTADMGLFLKNANATNNNMNVISFGDANGFGVAQIGAVIANHTSHYGRLFFSTNGTKRLTIDETGTVAIGGWLNASRISTPQPLLLDMDVPAIQTSETASSPYVHIFDHEDVARGVKAGGVLIADDYGYANPANNNLVVKGSIGIGTPLTSNPNSYKLAVNGKIGTKDIQVERNTTTWPDYVFSTEYELPSLIEVEKFIAENNHLKDVPSAKTVEANGHNLADMDEILLKKVEELTLYVIQQQKEIDALKQQLTKKGRKK